MNFLAKHLALLPIVKILMQAQIQQITVKFVFKPTENRMNENTIDRKIPQMTVHSRWVH